MVSPSRVARRIELRSISYSAASREQPPVAHKRPSGQLIRESQTARNIGGPPVMRAQLKHLARICERPNVEIRILPLNRNVSLAVSGSFQVMSFGSRDAPGPAGLGDIVSTETLRTELYIEGEDDTYLYRLAHNALADASLSPDESRYLMADIAHVRN